MTMYGPTLVSMNDNDRTIIFEEFNARVGNHITTGIKQEFNKKELIKNGELMIGVFTENELIIMNIFLDNKMEPKYIYGDMRGQR